MFTIGMTNYGSFDLLYVDVNKIKHEDTANGLKTLLKQSPAMAIKLDIEQMRNTMSFTGTRSDDPVTYALMNECAAERPLIIMDNRLATYLNEREMRAIFEHELSHIVHGDLDRPAAQGTFIDDLEVELAADARAASIVGKDAMCSALTKTLTMMAQQISIEYGDPIEKVISVLMENEGFKRRIAALS